MSPSSTSASTDGNSDIARLYQSLLATHQSTVASLNALETLHRSTALALATRTYEVTCLHTEIATLKLRVDALNDDIRYADESADVSQNSMAILKAEKAFITRQRNDAQSECRRLQIELSSAESGRAALTDATVAALNERIARMSENQQKMESNQSAIASSVRRIDSAQSAAATEAAQCMAKLDEAKALAARALEPIKSFRKTNNKRKNDSDQTVLIPAPTMDVTELANEVESISLTSKSPTINNETHEVDETTNDEPLADAVSEQKESSASVSSRPRRERAARRKPIIEDNSDIDSDYDERPEKSRKENKKSKKAARTTTTTDVMHETDENASAMSYEKTEDTDASSRPLVTLNDVSNKPSNAFKKAAANTKAKAESVTILPAPAPTKTKLFKGASSISAAVANAMNTEQPTTALASRFSAAVKIPLTMGLQSSNAPLTTAITNPPPRPMAASSFVFNNPFKSFLTAAAAPLPPVLTAPESDNFDM